MLLLYLQDVWQNANQAQVVPYNEFEKALAKVEVASVTVSDRSITGKLKTPVGNKIVLVATLTARGAFSNFGGHDEKE